MGVFGTLMKFIQVLHRILALGVCPCHVFTHSLKCKHAHCITRIHKAASQISCGNLCASGTGVGEVNTVHSGSKHLELLKGNTVLCEMTPCMGIGALRGKIPPQNVINNRIRTWAGECDKVV